MRCTRCNRAYYCNKDCQRNAWPQHKVSCNSIAETEARGGFSSATYSQGVQMDGRELRMMKLVTNPPGDDTKAAAEKIDKLISAAAAAGDPMNLCGLDEDGGSMMFYVGVRGLTDLAKVLVKHGVRACHHDVSHSRKVPVDLRNEFKETALHLAVMYGNEETAKWLIEAGADPTVADCHGNTILCGHSGKR